MTTAPELRTNGSTVPVSPRTEPVTGSPRFDPASGAPRPVPVLRRLPLPVTEPPFDDELGLPAGRPTVVGAGGRIVYLTGAATTAVPPSSTASAPPVFAPPASAPPASTSPAPAPPASAPSVFAPPAVRLRLVPPEGPADGSSAHQDHAVRERPIRPRVTRGVRPARPGRPTTTLERPDPSDGFAPGPRVDVDSTATRSRLLGTDDVDSANRAPAAPTTDPRPLAAQVVQAVVEILAGDRQLTQLTAWVDEEVYAAVAAAAPDAVVVAHRSLHRDTVNRTRPQDRPMVRSVHVCQPAPGIAEVSARVQTGGRSCAVALRLEGWRGRWRCNALTVG